MLLTQTLTVLKYSANGFCFTLMCSMSSAWRKTRYLWASSIWTCLMMLLSCTGYLLLWWFFPLSYENCTFVKTKFHSDVMAKGSDWVKKGLKFIGCIGIERCRGKVRSFPMLVPHTCALQDGAEWNARLFWCRFGPMFSIVWSIVTFRRWSSSLSGSTIEWLYEMRSCSQFN